MSQPWPGGGPWLVATTSAAVDWQLPAAALAAASTVRVAALVLSGRDEPGELLLGGLATVLHAGDGAADPLTVDEAAALVRTLAQTHGLVLVAGGPGLLVPAGRAGWTPLDLAVAVSAPVVVVTAEGPDSVNHTTLALDALTSRDLTATVIITGVREPAARHTAAGEPAKGDRAEEEAAGGEQAGAEPAAEEATAGEQAEPEPVAGEADARGLANELDAGLPVRPAGRIPARAAERTADFAAAARSWLDPMLHASAGRPKAEAPPPAPQPAPPRATTAGTRVVLLLAGVFVTMSLAVCGLAFCDRTVPEEALVQFETTVRPQVDTAPRAVPVPAPASPPPRADPCPEYQLRGAPTRADAGTTKRVHAAWKRIEKWLAAHAPASHRSLRPPASAAAIARVQQEMSVAFPPDLVASLRRHDGVTDGGFALPFLFKPLAVDAIPGEWSVTCGVLGNARDEWDGDWWHRSFVPFATAGDGGCLLVDQRPGGHGRVGEFYPEEGVDFARWPGSVTELLEKTARSLETGRPYDDRYRPTVTREGTLDWAIR